MEQRYEQEIVMPDLDQRKRELADKRNLYKRVTNDDITEHARAVRD
jgi:hypothetical protein